MSAAAVSANAANGKFYTLLNVPRNVDPTTLRKAYLLAAQQHHPDRGGDAERFKEIVHAYNILSDAKTRTWYDSILEKFEAASTTALPCAEVDLDDCEYDETTACYSYPCRCGAEYVIDEEILLQTGMDLFTCEQCSLMIRIMFEWQPPSSQSNPSLQDLNASSSSTTASNTKYPIASMDPNEMS